MSEFQSPSTTLEVMEEHLPHHVQLVVEERLAEFENAHADNTNRARASDFKIYKTWCTEHGLNSIPGTPEQLVQFLKHYSARQAVNTITKAPLYKNGKPVMEQWKSTATLSRYLSTIKYLHDIRYELVRELSGEHSDLDKYRNPASTRRVLLAMKGIRRKYRKAQRQAAPIRLDLIDLVMNSLDSSLRDTLYKALVAVGFETMMRCSELVNIHVDHIEYEDDGSGSIFLPFHKGDQFGKGSRRYISATTVDLIQDWLVMSGVNEGLLFRSVARNNSVLDAMHKDRVARIYKNIARRCGVDASDISAHSTRVGAAQELLANGVEMPALMSAGGWKSSSMPARYAEKHDIKKGAMADLAKVTGRTRQDHTTENF